MTLDELHKSRRKLAEAGAAALKAAGYGVKAATFADEMGATLTEWAELRGKQHTADQAVAEAALVRAQLEGRVAELEAAVAELEATAASVRGLRLYDAAAIVGEPAVLRVKAAPADQAGQDRPGPDRTGQDRTGPDKAGIPAAASKPPAKSRKADKVLAQP